MARPWTLFNSLRSDGVHWANVMPLLVELGLLRLATWFILPLDLAFWQAVNAASKGLLSERAVLGVTHFRLCEITTGVVRTSTVRILSLIHISEPTRQAEISYAVFCLKKKK